MLWWWQLQRHAAACRVTSPTPRAATLANPAVFDTTALGRAAALRDVTALQVGYGMWDGRVEIDAETERDVAPVRAATLCCFVHQRFAFGCAVLLLLV